LFEAVSGYRPFERNGDEDRFPQLDSERLPYPEHVPPALTSIIDATLAPQPADRPSAREIAESLEPLVAGLPKRPVIGRLKPRLG
jgi:hypothetical protein